MADPTKTTTPKKTYIGGSLIAVGIILTGYSFISNKTFTASIIGITGVVGAITGLIILVTPDPQD